MDDPYNLKRFVNAQAAVFEQACSELRAGRKRSHWMWFVFPQIAGLGRSETARTFAIASMEEARAYLAHPVLGPRLRDQSIPTSRDASPYAKRLVCIRIPTGSDSM